jgi:hypothetical protein
MATKRRAAAATRAKEAMDEKPLAIEDELTMSKVDPETPTLREEAEKFVAEKKAEVDAQMNEGMASMVAQMKQLQDRIAELEPKVPQPKAPFDGSNNSMERPDEWVNEFTTAEVLAYIESAAHEESGINAAELYAYRQRQAFEHKKAVNDPTNCPGWFITISGNIRRDY